MARSFIGMWHRRRTTSRMCSVCLRLGGSCARLLLLMVQKSGEKTTWDVNLVNSGKNYQPQLVSRISSNSSVTMFGMPSLNDPMSFLCRMDDPIRQSRSETIAANNKLQKNTKNRASVLEIKRLQTSNFEQF